MKKLQKVISIFLLLCILVNAIQPLTLAKSISECEKVNLVKDHMCNSLLKIRGQDILKLVAYVCYQDPDTGKKYPAFCVEPDKDRYRNWCRRFIRCKRVFA